MKKLLLTGFEPFNNMDSNPSEQLALLFNEKTIQNILISSMILPVTYKLLSEILNNKINELKPDFIIGLGLAVERKVLSVERVAVNLIDSSIPDNEGVVLKNQKIDQHVGDQLVSNLPVELMSDATNKLQIACKISDSAGSYVCNYLLFNILQSCKGTNIKGGFIHIPPLSELSLDKMQKAIEAMISVVSQVAS